MLKRVLTCVGTRPNFIKITQLDKYFERHSNIRHLLLHTGQHFDYEMNEVFFKELDIRKPDIFLNINRGSQLDLISRIISGMEGVLKEYQPDLVMVPGDVNSSLACAFAASRMGIPVAHIESGLRSFDRTMPEEINRILIDDLSDLLFVTEPSGEKNLLKEGKPKEKIKFTGNTMIDSLIAYMEKIEASTIRQRLKLENEYALMTFHRPANVDHPTKLEKLVNLIERCASYSDIVFPVHPRTMANLHKFDLFERLNRLPNVALIAPLGYLDFLHLLKYCKYVMTDSGGIQEEATFLKVPCLTLRNNTERPVTVDIGTNTLVPFDEDIVIQHIGHIFSGNYKSGQIPPLWDGKASERLTRHVIEFLTRQETAPVKSGV